MRSHMTLAALAAVLLTGCPKDACEKYCADLAYFNDVCQPEALEERELWLSWCPTLDDWDESVEWGIACPDNGCGMWGDSTQCHAGLARQYCEEVWHGRRDNMDTSTLTGQLALEESLDGCHQALQTDDLEALYDGDCGPVAERLGCW